MGSFTSAPFIPGADSQDVDVHFNDITNNYDMLARCRRELLNRPPLLKRSWVKINEPLTHTQLRIFQWNVLAQALGEQRDNFAKCSIDVLNWDSRRYRMLEEIVTHGPDVICLQEVDHFSFLRDALSSLGFFGMFIPKPDSPCVHVTGHNGPDGCALFYRASKLQLVKSSWRVLRAWGVRCNQVVLIAVLRDCDTGREFCVATTHLKARQGPLLAALRLEQGRDLLRFVNAECGPERPLILCGDFNAEPTEPIYNAVTQNNELKLRSAYVSLTGHCEPPYTTWKVREEGEISHTIDYMFYTKQHWDVNALLAFPTGDEMGPGRLPSLQYASDHLSLVADLTIRPEYGL